MSVLKWPAVAESQHKNICDKVKVLLCAKNIFLFTHVFLEKWINFQKICGSFFKKKGNVVLNVFFLCRVFISQYHWKHWLPSDIWLIFLTSEKIDIFIQLCYVVFPLLEYLLLASIFVCHSLQRGTKSHLKKQSPT